VYALALQDPVTADILAFLDRIGIRAEAEAVPEDSFLPAITIRDGALLFDPARLEWPGDLLHEAGHIAVTDPALRPTLCDVPSDPAEEMAAICWSYAAALEIGLDPSVVFHEHGYRGDGAWLTETFTGGSYIGLPMLHYLGLAADRRRAEELGVAPFPKMLRWLR
jgi:hypothetical protein